jgi:hypothetical protein
VKYYTANGIPWIETRENIGFYAPTRLLLLIDWKNFVEIWRRKTKVVNVAQHLRMFNQFSTGAEVVASSSQAWLPHPRGWWRHGWLIYALQILMMKIWLEFRFSVFTSWRTWQMIHSSFRLEYVLWPPTFVCFFWRLPEILECVFTDLQKNRNIKIRPGDLGIVWLFLWYVRQTRGRCSNRRKYSMGKL